MLLCLLKRVLSISIIHLSGVVRHLCLFGLCLYLSVPFSLSLNFSISLSVPVPFLFLCLCVFDTSDEVFVPDTNGTFSMLRSGPLRPGLVPGPRLLPLVL